MKKVILTVFITLLVIIVSSIIYIYSGSYDIGQVPHNVLTKWAITIAKEHSISKRIKDIKVPMINDTAIFVEGFRHYNEMCSTCHGGPGITPDELSKGLFPVPPQFYKSHDMPEPAEAFWIIKNGIKFTSMPAFRYTHDDQKIWAITSFLLNEMNKMSPGEYKEWQKKYAQMSGD